MFGRRSSWVGEGGGGVAPLPPINRPRKGHGSVQRPPLSGHRSLPPSPHPHPPETCVGGYPHVYSPNLLSLPMVVLFCLFFLHKTGNVSSLFLDLSMSTRKKIKKKKKKKDLREILRTYLCTL